MSFFVGLFMKKSENKKAHFLGFRDISGRRGGGNFQLSPGDKILAFFILQAFLKVSTFMTRGECLRSHSLSVLTLYMYKKSEPTIWWNHIWWNHIWYNHIWYLGIPLYFCLVKKLLYFGTQDIFGIPRFFWYPQIFLLPPDFLLIPDFFASPRFFCYPQIFLLPPDFFATPNFFCYP